MWQIKFQATSMTPFISGFIFTALTARIRYLPGQQRSRHTTPPSQIVAAMPVVDGMTGWWQLEHLYSHIHLCFRLSPTFERPAFSFLLHRVDTCTLARHRSLHTSHHVFLCAPLHTPISSCNSRSLICRLHNRPRSSGFPFWDSVLQRKLRLCGGRRWDRWTRSCYKTCPE